MPRPTNSGSKRNPRTQDTSKSTTLHVRVQWSEADVWAEFAKVRDVSIGAVVRAAMRKFLQPMTRLNSAASLESSTTALEPEPPG